MSLVGEPESHNIPSSDGRFAIGKGVLLATANVFVVALGIAVASGHGARLVVVLMLATAPCLVCFGVLFGMLAGSLATKSPRWRVALLAVPALGLAAVPGTLCEFRFITLVPLACIPTLVAALLLERWTRRVVPSQVPVATARSLRT